MNLTTTGRTVQLLKRICDTKTATEPFLAPSAEKTSLPLRDSQMPLERATPESEGISSELITRFLNELQQGDDLCMQSVLILRNGKLLCSAAWGAQRTEALKHTFSACKSITSLAIGLLMDDGLLHRDDTISELFSDLLTPAAARRLRSVTVEHLLTMRSGISFAEPHSIAESQWLHAILNNPLHTEPGSEFHYNSLNTYLLSAIVCRLTVGSMSDFLQKRLFDPMGICDTLWERSEEGIEKGGWGLYIRAEDMAKLGQLVMDGGVWQGSRLISREYLSAALSPQVTPPEDLGEFDYGYQIWVGRQENTFLFNGMLGQNVLGFRDSGILIVSNAGADTDYQRSRYFKIVSRYFGGSFPASLPDDLHSLEYLQNTIRILSFYNREQTGMEENAKLFVHRSFSAADPNAASVGLLPLFLQILHNNYTAGLTSVAISTRGALPELIYRERDATHRLMVGLGKPCISELTFHGSSFHVAAHGRFTHDEEERPVFFIRLEFLETPSVRILKLVLTGGGAILRQTETPGVPYLYQKLCDAAQQPLFRPFLLFTAGGSEEEYLLYKVQRILSPEIQMLPDN